LVSSICIQAICDSSNPSINFGWQISETAFEEIFSIEGIEVALEQNKMPLIIVRTETEEIVKWKS